MVAAIADRTCKFDYSFMALKELRVTTTPHPKTGKDVVSKILVQDEPVNPTQRFWTSLYSRYGFNSAFMKFYTHAEVFTRISEVEANDRMRLCIERDEATGEGTLLGVSNPNKPLVVYDELMGLLGRYNGLDVTYHDGIVESSHVPRTSGGVFQVGGDDFMNRFLMATPIDGYGAPNIYLALLRMVCQNGVVGYSKAFKSSVSLGKGDDDVAPTLTRALDGFGNDEGYAAIRSRLEEAARSWASVYEQESLYKVLVQAYGKNGIDESGGVPALAPRIRSLLHAPVDGVVEEVPNGGIGSQLLVAFNRMTGDAQRLYGVASLDALSMKRKKTLPVKCSVFDLVNFATEVSSHFATPSAARALQGWLGSLITEEYDLEGTRDRVESFADFHIDSKITAGLTG